MSVEPPLKPCPFCGCGESIVHLWPTFDSEASSSPKPETFWVSCDASRGGCGINHFGKSRMQAITKWNQRAAPAGGEAPQGGGASGGGT